ncbi:MAG: hypothetical protein JWO63_3154 [Frankiales bacterium]|nr:hypothetical protein [Frankiales bacterium]
MTSLSARGSSRRDTADARSHWSRPAKLLGRGFALLVAAGLAIDAYVHLDLASNYAPVKTSVLSQATLFRVEAAVAIVAAVAVLIRPRRVTALIAFAVAASALAVLLAYRYWDIGSIGPIPSMYEPVWFLKKTVSAWAEGGAAIAALAVLATTWPGKRGA